MKRDGLLRNIEKNVEKNERSKIPKDLIVEGVELNNNDRNEGALTNMLEKMGRGEVSEREER